MQPYLNDQYAPLAHIPELRGHEALPGKTWIDHSARPLLGMMVTAFFKGDLTTKLLTEWDGCVAYFHDGHALHWHGNLGFI